jgi:hypothetical protein
MSQGDTVMRSVLRGLALDPIRRYRIPFLVAVCWMLSGCAYTSPRSPGFAGQLKKNITERVWNNIDLAKINPIPPNLLIMLLRRWSVEGRPSHSVERESLA